MMMANVSKDSKGQEAKGMDLNQLPPWDKMLKQMVWQQLGDVRNQKILDFGSGEGWTAAHLAQHNDVTALEPSSDMLSRRVGHGSYRQLQGSLELATRMEKESFDMIVCHNVMEYVEDKASAMQTLVQLLKIGGCISIVKHNRAGRVMQMTVLLNAFEHAHELLDGGNGHSGQFGEIRYYNDEDILRWLPGMHREKLWGIRTFWDLQQKQECHQDAQWQEKMLALETRVSTIPAYQSVAFFHHLLLRKNM